MVTQSETLVIDPEFAFYGPMGFRYRRGARQSHHELSGLKRPRALARGCGARSRHGCWRRSKTCGRNFPANLSSFGARRPTATRIPPTLFLRAGRRGTARGRTGRPTWSGCSRTPSAFSAAKIIRRILGLAHNIDFEWIEDPRLRGNLRGAKPASCPRDDAGHAVVRHDRRRDGKRRESCATGSRISAGGAASASPVLIESKPRF